VRIAIVGAGALGSAFGAGFIGAGHDVAFIDVSAPLVDALNANGLTIVEGDRRSTLAVRATTDPGSVGVSDLVLLFVKAYATEDAARAITPLVSSDTVLVTLQNGLGAADVLAGQHARARIVSGVTYHAATTLEPGVVRHSLGPTVVGPHADDDIHASERLAGACADAGWPAQVLADIAPAVWKKLLLNCTNAVAALTGMNAATELGDPHVRQLVHDVMAESIAVAHALGHTGIELEASVQDAYALLAKAGEGRASMLQDFDAGRRTEVDALNGAVVRAADRLGLDVPINRALLALVKGWERVHGFASPAS
jgi:2-dehydropantoate 2-reductase